MDEETARNDKPDTLPKKTTNNASPKILKTSVSDAIKLITESKNSDLPFYVADLADIVRKHDTWKKNLPRVIPYYAVKSNCDPVVLQLLASLGAGFDCVSKWEINAALCAGCKPSDIIYAHPCKTRDFMRYAASEGVELMTFDSANELQKIKEVYPYAKLLIRMAVPNAQTTPHLNNKFGCDLAECKDLIKTARRLNLIIIGATFHVGGVCLDSEDYFRAIQMAREIFDISQKLGYKFSILDLGGGFPGYIGSEELFDSICFQINKGLKLYFPVHERLKIIAEPGCYYVCSAFTLCTKIIRKKEVVTDTNSKSNESSPKVMYYLNDGRHTSFCEGIEKYHYTARPFSNSSLIRPTLPSKLWGWSCRSNDCIMESCTLPSMEMDEYIVFDNMGAYSSVLSSNFNGLPKPKVVYVYSGGKSSYMSQFLAEHPCSLCEGPAIRDNLPEF